MHRNAPTMCALALLAVTASAAQPQFKTCESYADYMSPYASVPMPLGIVDLSAQRIWIQAYVDCQQSRKPHGKAPLKARRPAFDDSKPSD